VTHSFINPPHPQFDLILERIVDVPKELVWSAWTNPEYVKKWFTPAPWTTVDCEIDLRPGGIFQTTMRSPEGENIPDRRLLPRNHRAGAARLDHGASPRLSADN